MPRGMPGARRGGSSGDGSHSGGNSGDASGPVTVWEVVSLLGKLLGTVAALKVVLYLLRVCLAMAWKSGGASHSELIHNLCSKCHPRWVWGNWGRPGLDRVPRAVPSDLLAPSPPPLVCERASAQGGTSSPERHALAIASPGTCHSLATWTGTGEKEPAAAAGGAGGRRLPGGLGGEGAAQVVGLSLESSAWTSGSGGRGACTRGGEMLARPPRVWAGTEGSTLAPRVFSAQSSL